MTPELRQVLNLARWAPSGDNTQPWRFEVVGPMQVAVHYVPAPELGVFNLDHFAGRLALGALLETLAIAATAHGWQATARRRPESPATAPVYDVVFQSDPEVAPSPLAAHVETRATQRRTMPARPLSAAEKAVLEQSVGKLYRIIWLDSGPDKRWIARQLSQADKIRLTIPETFAVHRDTVAWGAQTSEDRIPDAAIAVDPLLRRLMRWAMGDWGRVELLNRLGGHWLPRLEMDVLPALRCGAHFLIVGTNPGRRLADHVAAGRAMQRFWLTAASLGLQLQPEMAPLIFSRYVAQGLRFSARARAWGDAMDIRARFAERLGRMEWEQALFMGRVGQAAPVRGRSLRKPLSALLVD
jgi:hypothetical protein